MPTPKIQPRLPKGMRDFLPQTMLKREYVYNAIREVFHLYGFEPMQTPVLELYETLMGKYGEDAERLIFNAQHPGGKEELALRYDLTVPLARFYAMYANDLPQPFRRYQITPVWRAERPQRGRYREFYQCDADIVGTGSISADAEIIGVAVSALKRLGFPQFVVKINNRKLLTAIGQYVGLEGQPLAELYRSIDKFDKIGADGVRAELAERGVPAEAGSRIMDLITVEASDDEKLALLTRTMGDLPAAAEAIGELAEVLNQLSILAVPRQHYAIDFTMVRGLGYYTGPIYETIIQEPNLGSVMGGGRYDDLLGMFKGERVPTTGMSLGIERIIDVMDILNLYPPAMGGTVVQVLVTVFSADTREAATRLAADLRGEGIRTELFMQDRPIGKQIGYADKKGVPLIALLGPDEMAAGTVKLKRLRDGQETTASRDALIETVTQLLNG